MDTSPGPDVSISHGFPRSLPAQAGCTGALRPRPPSVGRSWRCGSHQVGELVSAVVRAVSSRGECCEEDQPPSSHPSSACGAECFSCGTWLAATQAFPLAWGGGPSLPTVTLSLRLVAYHGISTWDFVFSFFHAAV